MKPFARALILLSIFAGSLIFFAALAAARLPQYLTTEINLGLRKIPGYAGGIGGASLALSTGRLEIWKLRVQKRRKTAPGAFISADRLRFKISLRDLMRRRIVLEIDLINPDALFLMRQRKPGMPRKYGLWKEFFARVPPFRVNRLSVRGGKIRVRNEEDIPPTDISFDRINADAFNLANEPRLAKSRSARLMGNARMLGHAPLRLAIEAKPFRGHADFHLKGRLRGFRLVELNPVLRHYTGMDLQKGSMDVEGDLTAQGGSYEGRVKRRLKNIRVLDRKEEAGLIARLKEAFVQAWINRRKDRETGQMRAEYALSGPLGYMDEDIFLANVWVAKTAFLQSLAPAPSAHVRMGTPEQAEEEWMALQARERERKKKDQ